MYVIPELKGVFNMAEAENTKATIKTAKKPTGQAKAVPKRAAAATPKKSTDKTTPQSKPKAAAKIMAKAIPPKGKTQDTKSRVKDEMSSFKTKAADGARAAAEKGKDRASEAVSSISKLIRDSAATIDQNVGSQYGDYARSAADKVEGFAGKMDAKDVDDLVGEARDFVRKSPAVAIGAAAAIGFVLARLVRSGRDDS
jgi:ElaB/YqjD/DUF883 family membrane-anchored ribosome-binding protein